MPKVFRQFPDGWPADQVADYFDKAISNLVGTTQADGPAYPTIIEIDSIFRNLVAGLTNTESIMEAVLLMRAHSAVLAGNMLAMGGQATESFMVFRGVLENALYALHMHKRGVWEIWINRHLDDASLKKSRDEFSYGNVARTLQETNAEIGQVASELYQRTIDFGAHPNERAATSSMQIIDADDKKTIKQNYLSGGTMPQVHALKSGCQIGVCALDIFRIVFVHRFDILGLRERLDELKRNL